MNRRTTGIVVAVLAVFGLAGCSNNAESAESKFTCTYEATVPVAKDFTVASMAQEMGIRYAGNWAGWDTLGIGPVGTAKKFFESRILTLNGLSSAYELISDRKLIVPAPCGAVEQR